MSHQYHPNCNNHSQPPSLAGNRHQCQVPNELAFDLGRETGDNLKNRDGCPGYLGSAYVEGCAVVPCRVYGAGSGSEVFYGHGGKEHKHQGKFDFLAMTNEMEWVRAEKGPIPHGHTPVEGGHEADGKPLYHALADVEGHRVLGKTGPHLHGSLIGIHGKEQFVPCYEILCWKNGCGPLKHC
ncbi:hypothetical protein RQP46_003138 [Phenoliferia psychrophenolica]